MSCLRAIPFVLALAAPTALAQSPDLAAITAIVQSEADAWNQGDAEAFAAHYASDGSFTNVIGQQIYGKPGFIAQHAMIFSTIYKGSHNVFTIGHVQWLRPDIAVVDIDGVLTGALHLPLGLRPAADGGLHVKLQEVMSKENGAWLIRSFHNVAVVEIPAQPAH
jgi:uncharacterized protein (TIGR02246 family)